MQANRSMRAQKLSVRWAIVDINSKLPARKKRFFSRELSCTDVLLDLRKPPRPGSANALPLALSTSFSL